MKQQIKKLLILAIYIGLIIINTNVYASTGKTTNETTRLRKEPSTDSDIVALISQDTEVEIISEEEEWYKVTYSNYTGYLRKDMLSVPNSSENTNTSLAQNTTTASNNNNTSNETTETEQSQEQQNQNELAENTNQTNSNAETNQTTENENAEELSIGYTGKLTSKLDIKILPSINSSIIATIDENTDFKVTDIINKWCYIETENNSGWVLLSKVKTNQETNQETNQTEEQPAKEEQSKEEENKQNSETKETSASTTTEKTTTKYVSAETLNLRESADNNANIISQLTLNTKVTVVETVDSTWSKVTVNGKTGYVASKFLSDSKITNSSRSEDLSRENSSAEKNNTENTKSSNEESKDTSNSSNSSTSNSGTTGANIANYAKQYLGYKYVSGGTSPSTGFDCSGFTYYVYKHFGITLSRTSTAQASNGVYVSKSDMQAGDLVIFNNSSNSAIGHVGIYIGGNTFIHAANSTKGVITTSLSDSYYNSRYVSARRIIN